MAVTIAEKAGVIFTDEYRCTDVFGITSVNTQKKIWTKPTEPDDTRTVYTDYEKTLIKTEARESYLAIIFFMNSSDAQYAAYKQD